MIQIKKSLILFLILLMVSLVFAVVNQPTLNSPSNQTFTNDNTPDFNFTITGNWTSYSCELFLNDTGYGTNTTTTNNTATIITANDTVSDSFYNWYINCTNSTTNQSEIREITIDTINPLFSITTSNNTISNTLVTIEGTASDTNEDSIYSNNTAWAWNGNYTNWNFTNSSNILDGNYHILITANDSAGNTNSSMFNFTYDTTNPLVTISYPSANAFLNGNEFWVNGTATETNEDTIIINDTNWGTNQGSYSAWSFKNISSVLDGNYHILITANDSAGNLNNTEIVNFTVDNTNPLISFDTGTPDNATTSTFTYIYINWTYTELNLKNITAYLYNSTLDLINETSFLTATYSINWTGLSYDTYYFNVTVYDLAGNLNSTETRKRTLKATVVAEEEDIGVLDDTSGGGAQEVASREAEALYNQSIATTLTETTSGNWIFEIGSKFSPQNPTLGFVVFCGLIILIFLSFNTAPEFWKIFLWNSHNKGNR